MGGVDDGSGCKIRSQDRPLTAMCSSISSELAATWRYTYWLECLLVSILDESGNSSGGSQTLHKKQHVEVHSVVFLFSILSHGTLQALAAILRDYTAVTGNKTGSKPADAVLRPLMLASNSPLITLPASPIQVRLDNLFRRPCLWLELILQSSFEIFGRVTTAEGLRSFC